MNTSVNLRISRSGFAVSSSPFPKMGKDSKDNKSQNSPNNNNNTGTGGGKGIEQEKDTMTCSAQDIWGLITSMQTTMMKQSEEIKNLALKNQDLEHKLQLQDIRMLQQEKQLQELQEAFNKQTAKMQDTLASHDEKLTHIGDKPMTNVSGHAGSYATTVRNGQAKLNTKCMNEEMYDNEDETEYSEQEKRKMNIVIRGIQEIDKEQVLTLNADITDIISTKFGMHDVVVYGAHRVGKRKPETNRAIVCTLLDARKRAIILENARIYLQDSPYYISEDRTPNQQKARREAYAARNNKKPPLTEKIEPEK